MSKKSDEFYFNNFVQSISISCEAAEALKKILLSFSVTTLDENLKLMHDIESRGDMLRHELVEEIARAFITPMERDDIIQLSDNIDHVTDSIEDILIHIYTSDITFIRKDALDFADLVIKCCNTTKNMLEEFPDFKRSKKLHDLIIEVNRIEEEGDATYIKSLRRLHTSKDNLLEIIVWREIYEYFEKCCDVCEDVADIVESITIGNT